MQTPRPAIALAPLTLLAILVLAVQPAAAASGAYSQPGDCGGTSPLAVACTSQNIDLPAGASSVSGIARIGVYCLTSPCDVGTIRIDMQITGFSPTSYDPAYTRTGTCWITEDDGWCANASTSGSFSAGYDFVISGQISRTACAAVCADVPPLVDWCVGIRFDGAGSCPLENPVLGDVALAGVTPSL